MNCAHFWITIAWNILCFFLTAVFYSIAVFGIARFQPDWWHVILVVLVTILSDRFQRDCLRDAYGIRDAKSRLGAEHADRSIKAYWCMITNSTGIHQNRAVGQISFSGDCIYVSFGVYGYKVCIHNPKEQLMAVATEMPMRIGIKIEHRSPCADSPIYAWMPGAAEVLDVFRQVSPSQPCA